MTDSLPFGWGAAHTLVPRNLRRELLRAFPAEWKSVYRHQGLPALLRCLDGTRQLLRVSLVQTTPSNSLDCLSCTVIPEIGSLWGRFMSSALQGQKANLLLADSSGKLKPTAIPGARVLPLFNFNHGTKLDLLMKQACAADLVLICDDDIIWLDPSPLEWAIDQFALDDKLAVVSFHPRPHKIPQLRDQVDEAMGSYCILVRRSTWLEQGLSFKFYKSLDWKTIGNYFDTADYANLLLVQRGFRVLIAPPELREKLVPFYGTSMWGLKILTSRGQVNTVVNPNRPDEYKKAYRVALALRGFQDLLQQLKSTQKPLINPQFLAKALEVSQANLDAKTRDEVAVDIQSKLLRMSQGLASWSNPVPPSPQG